MSESCKVLLCCATKSEFCESWNEECFTPRRRRVTLCVDTIFLLDENWTHQVQGSGVYLLERHDEVTCSDLCATPSVKELVQMTLDTVTPREWHFQDSVLVVHAPAEKSKIPLAPMTFNCMAHRVQVLLEGSEITCHGDTWVVLGRKKRERAVRNGAKTVITFFARDKQTAENFQRLFKRSGTSATLSSMVLG
eukprot:5258903-Amphidinium_carterae.4